MARTDTETQLKVLARIARGDTYQAISNDTGMPITTIADIKKRNESALQDIKGRLIDHEVSRSKKILDKSQDLIIRQLSRAERVEDERQKLIEQRQNEEISQDEFMARWGTLKEPTLAELNSISKTAFDQSQVEQGKPTSISGNNTQNIDQLKSVLDLLNKPGSEVELLSVVMKKDQIIEGETVE